jgi:hypothetical protein
VRCPPDPFGPFAGIRSGANLEFFACADFKAPTSAVSPSGPQTKFARNQEIILFQASVAALGLYASRRVSLKKAWAAPG